MQFKISKLIILLTFLYLPIDTLNGLLIRSLDVSISPVYKAVILILIIIYLIRQKKLAFFNWIVVFSILLLTHSFGNMFSGLEVSWAIKFIAIVFSFLFFRELVIREGAKDIFKLSKISFWIIAFNVILGLLGFGYAQYARNDIGTRGLFYAGNELGILLIVISLIILSKLLIENKVRGYLLYAILFLFIATTLSTKTAVLGQVLIIFSLPMIHFRQTQKKLVIAKTSLKLVGFALSIIFFGLPFLINYVLYDMNLISRISFWSDRVGLTTLILSGRDLRAIEVYEYLRINSSFLYNIFGYGYENLIAIIDGDIVEIDIVDIFMIFGVVGVVTMYGFLILQFFKKKNSQHFKYSPYVKFGVLLLIILSCMSGHVLNSGLAGIMIGSFLALQYLDFRKFEYEQE